MQDWQDYSELWAQKDSITTVVEANGYSVWDIRLSSGVLYVELCHHLTDEQMSDLLIMHISGVPALSRDTRGRRHHR